MLKVRSTSAIRALTWLLVALHRQYGLRSNPPACVEAKNCNQPNNPRGSSAHNHGPQGAIAFANASSSSRPPKTLCGFQPISIAGAAP